MTRKQLIHRVEYAKKHGAKFRAIVSTAKSESGTLLMVSQQIRIDGRFVTDPTVDSVPVEQDSQAQLQSVIEHALAGRLDRLTA